MLRKIITEHIDEIEREYVESRFLNRLIQDSHSEIDGDVYIAAIIKMCINYESFTTEAYEVIFPGKSVKFNHPWSYTRKMASRLKLNIEHEYLRAHESWDVYNSIKHLNKRMLILREKICKRENLNSHEELANFIKNSLVNLLRKFLV